MNNNVDDPLAILWLIGVAIMRRLEEVGFFFKDLSRKIETGFNQWVIVDSIIIKKFIPIERERVYDVTIRCVKRDNIFLKILKRNAASIIDSVFDKRNKILTRTRKNLIKKNKNYLLWLNLTIFENLRI